RCEWGRYRGGAVGSSTPARASAPPACRPEVSAQPRRCPSPSSISTDAAMGCASGRLQGGGEPQHHLVENDAARRARPQSAVAAALEQAQCDEIVNDTGARQQAADGSKPLQI